MADNPFDQFDTAAPAAASTTAPAAAPAATGNPFDQFDGHADQATLIDRPKATDPPIIISAIRPHPQEIDPRANVGEFGDQNLGDAQYHTALSDADKAEYRSFFKDRAHPPSAAQLGLWYHQKTGAYLANAQDIVNAFHQTGKFLTQEQIHVPTKRQNAGAAYTSHVANAAAGDYGPEAGAVLDTVGLGGGDRPSIWNSDGSLRDLWANNADLERGQLERDSADHPIASIAGELTGAGLTAPLAGVVADAAGVAKLAEDAPVLASAGKAATGGAVYGSGAAGPGGRIRGAVTGAALGGATDVAIPAVKGLLSGSSAGKEANAAFASAAQRQGVDYMAADLPNSLKSKFATALASLSFGAISLAKQGEKNIATASAAADRVANDVGAVTDRTGAGQAAQRGANQFIQDTGDKLNDLETNIPIATNAPAAVNNTRSALSDIAQSFQSNPKLAAAFKDPKISAYLDALTPQTEKVATGLVDGAGNPITRDVTHGGGLSWSDLRDFRSRVGQIIGKPGLTSDGAQLGQLRQLYGALSDDIRQTAQQNGDQAGNAWSRWNNYARARSDRIENVVSLILGKNNDRAPQSAFEALQGLANEKGGDPLKLARALRSMPEEEGNSVRATILDGLGDANPGQQNGIGDVFSPAQWVTNWNKLSDRAKNVLFTGAHRDALNDLADLFSGMKSSTKFANTSKTGISVVASANTGLIWAHPVLGSIAAALEVGGGKLLASPAFARKVAGTPLNAKAAASYWNRPWVSGLVNQNPAIAGEIRAFQAAVNDNLQKAQIAASPDANGPSQNQQPN